MDAAKSALVGANEASDGKKTECQSDRIHSSSLDENLQEVSR